MNRKIYIYNLALFLSVLFLYSCSNPNEKGATTIGFPQLSWKSDDVKEGILEIKEEAKNCSIQMNLRHHSEMTIKKLPLKVEHIDASGKSNTYTMDVIMRDDNNEIMGDAMGDLCDLTFALKGAENIDFSKGKHTFKISYHSEEQQAGFIEMDIKILSK